jgi:FeS assembly SUF system protein
MGIFDIKPWRKRTTHPSGLDGPLEVGDPRPVAEMVEPAHMAAPASTLVQSEAKPPAPAPEACQKPECEKTLHDRVIEQICMVYDPEIPVNIYELGLIYDVLVEGDKARVQMTLTSPQCPSAQEIPVDVKYRVEQLPEIAEATVDIVWEPPWDPSKMSEMAKLELGMF